MKKPSWVIFDIGGVLLDWRRSADSLAEYLGTNSNSLLDALFKYAPQMNVGKISVSEGWAEIVKDLGSNEDPKQIILKWRDSEFWFQDSLKLVADLHEAGYKLAIFSNSWLGLTDQAEASSFPEQIRLFDMVFDSSKDGLTKPEEKYYRMVEEKLGAKGQSIFFIDDDTRNLVPGRRLGWQTFYYSSGDGKELHSNRKLRALLLK